MKKTYLNTIALSLTLWGLSGCSESFVDLTSPTAVSPSNYFKSEVDIRAALTGIYGGLRGHYSDWVTMAELPSDNSTDAADTRAFIGDFETLGWRPTNGTVASRWNGSYALIARANILLNRIEGVSMNETLKARYVAEAKFHRALLYFNLVRLFGAVPLVLNEVKTEAEAYTYKREAVPVVYAQIIKDLQEAEPILPQRYTGNDIGRATQGAAKSLLGKVYLTQGNFASAATKLREVIDSRVYSLLPNYADVFRATNGNNAEIVYAVQYTGGTFNEGSDFFVRFTPSGSVGIVNAGPLGSQNLGTKDLFDAFEAGDTRKDVSIRTFVSGTSTTYYTYKFFDSATVGSEGNNDWPVIRYADVLLMYAEALAETGATADALTNLNLVRKRAGLRDATATTLDALRLALEQERRVELAFEGHRWLDLIRTGRMVPVMTAFRTRTNSTNIQVTAQKALYPIPTRELQLNPSLEQNAGY